MEWRSGKRGFAVLLALLGVLAVACWPAAARAASWFVDEAGFHASAHRDIACADCHPDQADGDHPRLDKLNKAARTAKPASCAMPLWKKSWLRAGTRASRS